MVHRIIFHLLNDTVLNGPVNCKTERPCKNCFDLALQIALPQPANWHRSVAVTHTLRVPVSSHEYNGVSVAVNTFIEFNDRVPQTFVLCRSRLKQIRESAQIGSGNDHQKA